VIATPTTMDVPLRADEAGVIRVGESRVLLQVVIHAFNQGETAEGIVDSYPSLMLADVYGVIAYYLTHRPEVDDYIARVEEKAGQLRKDIEAGYTPDDLALFDRLRAIRDQQQRR